MNMAALSQCKDNVLVMVNTSETSRRLAVSLELKYSKYSPSSTSTSHTLEVVSDANDGIAAAAAAASGAGKRGSSNAGKPADVPVPAAASDSVQTQAPYLL
jgi:hypothetical protein